MPFSSGFASVRSRLELAVAVRCCYTKRSAFTGLVCGIAGIYERFHSIWRELSLTSESVVKSSPKRVSLLMPKSSGYMRQTRYMPEPSIIVRDPEIMSGTPCFRGTRVPFQALLDYLEGGETLDEFLDQFPTVRREMAIAALETAKDKLLASIE
jgi:uncharacterized protein (DUF433 family)